MEIYKGEDERMFNSLKLIESVCTSDLDGLTLEEVVFKFQNTNDRKLQNRCFSKVFCDLFPMILKIHHKFTNLTLTERTEECIYCTYHAMRKYKFNSSKKMKFSSFLYLVVQNSLKGLVMRQNNNDNRKVWSNLADCDTKTLNRIYDSLKYRKSDVPDLDFNMDIGNSSILNSQELDLCRSLMLGYKSNKDMVNLIDIRPKKVFDKQSKEYITKPLTDAKKVAYIAKLKRELKKKIKENNYTLI